MHVQFSAHLVFGTHKFSRLTPTLISLHWLPLNKRSVFKICTLMFKIKNNHSPNYLADLSSCLLVRDRYLLILIFRIPSNSTYAKSALSYCGPFYGTLFPPISPLLLLPLLLLYFHFVKPLKLCCSNSS